MDKSGWVRPSYSWLGITLLILSESSLKEVSYIYWLVLIRLLLLVVV